MRINRYWIFAATLLVALALSVAPAAADQHSGTWKMNPAKSKYSPGPAAKNLTLKVESDDKGVKVDSEGIDGEGNPTHVQYDAKFDGKDYPVTGVANGDTVSVKRIDANTIQTTIKKGDQVVMTVTARVSADGKTGLPHSKVRMRRATS
jgi:hypothetical protein